MLRTTPFAAGKGPCPADPSSVGPPVKTRTLLILAAVAGLAILIAFTLQITLAAR